jgi:serine/threonine protein kinase
MEDMVSMKLGPYRLLSRLARGGMSEVFLVSDERDEQVYALKMVRQRDEEYCQRFQHEIKMLMFLKHPHILPIVNYGSQEDICYYVMPYIAHGTLKNRIERGPLNEKEAEAVLAQVAAALQFLHEAGFVHRDVKSSNMLQDETNHIWLADFGLVIEIERGSDLTMTGCLMGTPSYMAPELGHAQASVSSDIYALGVVLYEMVTGRLPFHGRTPIDIFLKHVYEQPPFPSTLNPLLSPAIEHVLLHALEKNPPDRYVSAQALAKAYQQALLPEIVASSTFRRLENRGKGVIPIKPVNVIRSQQQGRARRRSLAIGALATMALLTLALGSMGVTSQSGIALLPSSAAQAISIQPVGVSPTPTPPGKTPVPSATSVSTPSTSEKPPKKSHGKPHKHHG